MAVSCFHAVAILTDSELEGVCKMLENSNQLRLLREGLGLPTQPELLSNTTTLLNDLTQWREWSGDTMECWSRRNTLHRTLRNIGLKGRDRAIMILPCQFSSQS